MSPALTKHDIAEYYTDPDVRQAILAQIKNKPVLAVQSLPSGNIHRRNNRKGKPIRILQASNSARNQGDLAWFTDRRYSEFHPTIGRKTRQVWVDIDPGPERDFESLKPVVSEVAAALKKLPQIKDTNITYSGGRGFHVRGTLRRKEFTDDMRRRLEEHLRQLDIPGAVQRKPIGDEVRLDTSTLKNKGSIRAAYSLNSETGRVAVPLTKRELRGFQPEQAEVKRLLKEKEFAPGIPRSKRIYALPQKQEGKQWTLAVQEHEAQRAGRHWDLRLVDPHTGFAHSWAVPKAQFPEGDRKLLAVRTPTHTEHYALNFGDAEPEEIRTGYGQGTVKIVHKEPVKIVKSDNNQIQFERILEKDDDRLVLFRTKGDNWMLRRKPAKREKRGNDMSVFRQLGYRDCLQKLGLDETPEMAASETVNPLDMQDEHLPAGELAAVISALNHPDYSERSKGKNPDQRVEDRLNRDVQWSSPQDIPSNYMDGATIGIPGGGL